MAAMDLLGRRWTLRILFELRRGPLGARELQLRCDQMSSSVLYQRLTELSDAELVEQDSSGQYLLTKVGSALNDALMPLDGWSRGWQRSLQRGA